jgi:hypothetical protein
VNRQQRRKQRVRLAVPGGDADRVVAFPIRCPGVHSSGCPASAMILIAIGMAPETGLSGARLHELVTADGWHVGAGRIEVPGQGVLPVLDPLCPSCGAALAEAILRESGGRGDPEAIGALHTIAASGKEPLEE